VRLSKQVFSLTGLRYAAFLTAVTVLGSGVAFAAVENGRGPEGGQVVTTWDGIWWAVTTVTTVGYGDIDVNTTAGRALGILVMFAGIGFVAVLTGALARRFLAEQATEVEEATADTLSGHEQEVLRRLDALATEVRQLREQLEPDPRQPS
jgi:voltage-gated potassium channel